MPQDAAMREIDEALLEVSEELAPEELGGRRRKVFYRSRTKRVGTDLNLGIPGTRSEYWKLISPTPVTQDVTRMYEVQPIGVIDQGDIEMRVDRLALSKAILLDAEFYLNDDPDAPDPEVDTPANYDTIGSQVLQGGGGVRERFTSSWLLYLRLRQNG